MKCNVNRAFEREDKPYDVVKDFQQFLMKEIEKDFLDKKTNTLNDKFFKTLCTDIEEINLSRQERNIETFINLDMPEDHHTGIYIDDAYPDKKRVLKTTDDFINLYVYINTMVFKALCLNGILPF